MFKINAAQRLKATEREVHAVSEKMKPEMDKAMAAFVKAFGKDYTPGLSSESYIRGKEYNYETALWFVSTGYDHVHVTLVYDEARDGMRYHLSSEGVFRYYKSKLFRKAADLIKDMKYQVQQKTQDSKRLTHGEEAFLEKIKKLK